MALKRLVSTLIAPLLATAALSMMVPCAGAQTYKVLYNFTGGTDGGGVYGGLVMDKQGNLYGTTSGGGVYGYGTVFELSPNSDGTWSESVLHSFMLNDPDGSEPMSTLVLDAAGNLYGTAPNGGPHNAGTAFELKPASDGWTLNVLYGFCAQSLCSDGATPPSGLIMDGRGNLYGASGGGAFESGAIMELSPTSGGWIEKVLYSLGGNNGVGGYAPSSGLVFDSAGDLYGGTVWGGDLSCGNGNGCGVIYGLRHTTTGWKESVLHSFGSVQGDGITPSGGRLTLDTKGNIYGATVSGGGTGCEGGCGTLFRVVRRASERVESPIRKFGTGANGAFPIAGTVFDQVGNFYGVTSAGGQTVCDCGVVYKMTPASSGGWTYSVLHALTGFDGAAPSGLIMDSVGNLYGTTVTGGSGGAGVVFELTP